MQDKNYRRNPKSQEIVSKFGTVLTIILLVYFKKDIAQFRSAVSRNVICVMLNVRIKMLNVFLKIKRIKITDNSFFQMDLSIYYENYFYISLSTSLI